MSERTAIDAAVMAIDQLAAIRLACADAGFTDAESQADPAKVIRTLAAVLGEREKELLALREKAQWSIY